MNARRWLLRTLVLAGLLVLGGCASWDYDPLTIPDDFREVQTKSSQGATVSVAILTDEHARAHFGIDLGAYDLQAIWVRVENATDQRLWFLRSVLDMDFYPAGEVASLARSSIPDEDFEAARQRLRDESMGLRLEPGTITEGFVFAPKALGGRYVDVRLVEDAYAAELKRRRAEAQGESAPDAEVIELRFGFALPLPDGIFDYERLHPETIYGDEPLPELSREALRERLAALPCCSTNEAGDEDGDPLNIVIIGRSSDVLNALSRAGWSFTHRITFKSVGRMIGAALSDTAYPVAPVSDLFAFGRKQDFALQRARANIAERNHMRLWLAPFRHDGRQVWVGQVSRDIGIKLTPDAPTLTTHVIDPEVDQAREYLLQSLLAGGFVKAFGFVEGSRRATREAPAQNLVEDPYFSDGERLVLLLSPDPIPYAKVRSLLWQQSDAPVAEGQTAGAAARVRPIDGEPEAIAAD
ncbi:MAG TPA: hypothetical protein DD491_11945 [Halieaceae bacterium]|nr:hypothetical protein [Halieaceae bacterium]